MILPPGDESNGTVEEEAFKLAIDQINADNVNYPDVKLRGLIRYSDPDDDFDNIEQGTQCCYHHCVHPASRASLKLRERKERRCRNRVTSLLSMHLLLLGYNFEPGWIRNSHT